MATSEVKVNTLAKSSGNHISMDCALGLKSYTTTQRGTLTSAAGDLIYNSTDGKPQVYNGSSWQSLTA